jgi:hypothetical protein
MIYQSFVFGFKWYGGTIINFDWLTMDILNMQLCSSKGLDESIGFNHSPSPSTYSTDLTPKHLRRTFWLFADLGRLL